MFQKIKNQLHTKKNLYFIFMSYIVLLLLLLLISSLIYIVAIRVIDDEVQNVMQGTLYQTRNHFDENFTKVKSALYSILESPYVINLASSDANISNREAVERYRNVTRDISVSLSNISNVEDCIVILAEKNICFESSGKSEKLDVYNRFFNKYYANEQAWLSDIFATEKLNEFKILRNANGEKKVALVVRYPNFGMPIKAVAICFFNTDSMMAGIDKPYSDSAEIFITDNAGNVLFGTADSKNYYEYLADSAQNKVNDEKFIITKIKSISMDWEYVLLFHRETYMSKAQSVRTVAIYCYAFCVIIGLAVAIYFSIRNYRPIKNIVAKINRNNMFEKVGDEYAYVEQVLHEMLENKDKMEAEIAEKDVRLKSFFFSKIVNGKMDIDNFDDKLLKQHGIELDGYRCVLLYNVTDLGLLGNIHGKTVDNNAICFLLSNVFSELMGSNVNCCFFEADGMYACLLCSKNEMYREVIYENTRLTVKFFEENFSMNITCAMGEVNYKTASISEMFEKTKELIDVQFLMGDKKVLCRADIDENEGGYVFSTWMEYKLVTTIKMGDEEGARDIINWIFNEGIAGYKTNIIKILEHDILSTLLKLSNKLDERQTSQMFIDISIKDMESLERMRDIIIVCAMQLCEEFKKRGNSSDVKIKHILDYIHDNYANKDLNVDFLAEKFEISSSYFSRYFKERTCEGAAEYINDYRMQKAREYLETGEYSVAETSDLCGFNNVNIFIRVFKKVTGVTPGKYRG